MRARAVAAYVATGSVRGAARETGIPPATVSRWLRDDSRPKGPIPRQRPLETARGIDVNLFLSLRRPHGRRCTTRRRDGASEIGCPPEAHREDALHARRGNVPAERGLTRTPPHRCVAPRPRLVKVPSTVLSFRGGRGRHGCRGVPGSGRRVSVEGDACRTDARSSVRTDPASAPQALGRIDGPESLRGWHL